jgi:hypothetical protein
MMRLSLKAAITNDIVMRLVIRGTAALCAYGLSRYPANRVNLEPAHLRAFEHRY